MLSLLTHQPRPFLMNKKKIYSNEFKQSVLNNIFALVCFITVRSEYICMDLLLPAGPTARTNLTTFYSEDFSLLKTQD